jgi:hypothetical protein
VHRSASKNGLGNFSIWGPNPNFHGLAAGHQRETGAQMKAPDTSPEARLLGFLNVANKGDLEGGRLAQERREVWRSRPMADKCRGDHMQMLQKSEAVATRLGLVPAMGPEARPLIQGA